MENLRERNGHNLFELEFIQFLTMALTKIDKTEEYQLLVLELIKSIRMKKNWKKFENACKNARDYLITLDKIH